MAEPSSSASNPNPQKTVNLQITPVSYLKNSIIALQDDEFNPEGIARVDITEGGFHLSVVNKFTKTIGHLFLNSTHLINFHCSKPIVDMFIRLHDIPLHILGHTSQDNVTIFHRDNDNHLTLVFGGCKSEHRVLFLELTSEIHKNHMYPDINKLCETVWTTEKVKQMIEHLERTGTSQEVSIDISKSFVSVFIGNKHPWIERSNDDNEAITRGMQPGTHHHAWFKMHHLGMLKKATLVTPNCSIFFLTGPVGNVMMRFAFGDGQHGNLVSIHEADIISYSDDFIRLGIERRFNKPA